MLFAMTFLRNSGCSITERVAPVTTRAAVGALAAVAHPRMDQIAQLVGDEEVLDPAVAAGVLEQDGQELRFAHPLLAAGAAVAEPQHPRGDQCCRPSGER